jgi:hypothetical protein
MNRWLRIFVKWLAPVLALLVVLSILAWWLGNRDAAPVSRADQQQSYQRAVGWIKANEAWVRAEPNAALLWMLQEAGEKMGDRYLLDLVREVTASNYGGTSAGVPWQRMIYPKAEAILNLVQTEPLLPYQRFFYHAVSCQPLELKQGDTNRFLQENMCRPQVWRVLAMEPACTTHQLIGVRLFRRTACPVAWDTSALEAELLSDIESQLRFDVVVKDAYLQRVLMMVWTGHAERVQAIWMRRVLAVQGADGGWQGKRQFPELTAQLAKWGIQSRLAAWWPGWLRDPTGASDFHATAQGLLIAAISLSQSKTTPAQASLR